MDNTVYIRSGKKRARLFAVWGDERLVFELNGRQRMGRPTGSDVPDIPITSRNVSRKCHGEFNTVPGHCSYCDPGSTNGTYLNGRLIRQGVPVALKDGDVLVIHGIEDRDRVLDVVLIYSESYHDNIVWQTLALGDEIENIDVGRAESLALRDKAVSRHHASFFKASGGWAIIDHHSTNGVKVNNRAVQGSQYLQAMDVVDIAGYPFIFTGSRLIYASDRSGQRAGQDSASLLIDIKERNVWHRMKKKTLLKDIRLEIENGSMVLILGGSGAGKTTFMNAVMGYEPAEGRILYKNTDIYQEYEKMKYEIGYVPQQDLLRVNDTVHATLDNAAKMRLPRHTGQAALDRAVDKTLDTLGLTAERDSLVGKLSGGQRKRLSIAVEYIGNPSLFFLDEPDSGLDGATAEALMKNLRAIADDDKIVIVISHSPDRAFDLFDRIIVLAKSRDDNSGHLVFTGSPAEACAFFETDCLEKIVRRINRTDEGGEGKADYYIKRFEARGGCV